MHSYRPDLLETAHYYYSVVLYSFTYRHTHCAPAVAIQARSLLVEITFCTGEYLFSDAF